jgi:hypothetical protein
MHRQSGTYRQFHVFGNSSLLSFYRDITQLFKDDNFRDSSFNPCFRASEKVPCIGAS